MGSRARVVRRVATLALTLAAATILGGRPSAACEDPAGETHVRGLDHHSRALIAQATATSPSIRELLATLDASDVIVLVSVTFMTGDLRGDTRFLSVTPRARILSVRIAAMRSPRDQVETLGHELRHAAEVAAAPEARDDDSLRTLMTKIGWSLASGRVFETPGAIEAARHVRLDISAHKPAHPRERAYPAIVPWIARQVTFVLPTVH